MTTTKRKPTEKQMEKVRAAVARQRKAAVFGDGPTVMMEFDWLGTGPYPAIVWEEGPFEWAYLFPFGGIEEEFGFKVGNVEAAIPKGWYAEPITGWAIAIYRA